MNNTMSSADILAYLSIFLSFLSMCIAMLIAYRQGKIAKETLEIGKDTKSITEKFETDRSLREKASKLFPAKGKAEEEEPYKYKIVYPVKYQNKPLPLINQGDFYAINSITIALGIDNVELQEIHDDGKVVPDFAPRENLIFICSPQANPALNKVLRYEVVDEDFLESEDENKKIINWLKDIKLPCWFLSVREKAEDKEIKKIQIYDKDDLDKILDAPLSSPADKCYRLSCIEAKSQCGKVKDYGIFARITEKDNVYVVVAGIHQYGTWIVADYLNGLLRRKTRASEVQQIFESANDFIAVIRGEFVTKTLNVDWSDIDGRNLWVKTAEGNWIRHDRVNPAEKHITSALRRTVFSLRSKTAA